MDSQDEFVVRKKASRIDGRHVKSRVRVIKDLSMGICLLHHQLEITAQHTFAAIVEAASMTSLILPAICKPGLSFPCGGKEKQHMNLAGSRCEPLKGNDG